LLRLHSRLQKLEAQIIDGSGFRPHSLEWLDYWVQRVTGILIGETAGAPGCIPLEVWDALGAAPSTGNQDLAEIATAVAPGSRRDSCR
jgi:hypothetical protein